jgi:AcrR family transcriptional regulator
MTRVAARRRGRPPRKEKEIVSAAKRLFRRYGVKRVTVEEIVGEAGVGKATFYRYFPNKTALVKRIMGELNDVVLERTDAVLRQQRPFDEKVRLLIDDKLRQASSTSEAFFDEFFRADDPEVRAHIDALLHQSQRRFVDFMVEAQAYGQVRTEIRPEFMLALLGKINELAADEALRACYPDYVSFTRELIDFLFYGLLSARSASSSAP